MSDRGHMAHEASKKTRTPLTLEIRAIPMLDCLPADALATLCPISFVREFSRGSTIWREDDRFAAFAFILAGRGKLLMRQPTGRETLLNIASTGELLFTNAPERCGELFCECVADESPTRVLLVRSQPALELMARQPSGLNRFMSEMVRHERALCARIGELAAGRVEQRIALLLLRLCDQLAPPSGRPSPVPVRLSRRDIAQLCATTPETATRIMRRFEKDCIVENCELGLRVVRRVALAKIAEGYSAGIMAGR